MESKRKDIRHIFTLRSLVVETVNMVPLDYLLTHGAHAQRGLL